MTCIIGIANNGKITMGADSASVSGYNGRVTNLSKVFIVDKFIVGYTDSFRMGQILEHHLSVRPQNDKDDKSDCNYMVRVFIEEVREVLKVYGFAEIDNNVEEGGTFLVGYSGKLYTVYSDFQINEYVDEYSSIGCGREYALGAMAAYKNLHPKERVQKSLEVAGHFSVGVMPPYIIKEL